MLTIVRWCVACKIQVRSCKVKVTLLGQTTKIGYMFPVRTITLSFLDGSLNYLAEMFTIIRQCVLCRTQVRSCKVKVTLRGQRWKIWYNFRVRSTTLSFLNGFWYYQLEMFTIMRRCVACKTQVHSCKVKVKLRDQRSKIEYIFRVRSMTLSFFDTFLNYLVEMFTIIRQNVVGKTQIRSSNGKVTLRSQSSKEGHIFRVGSIFHDFLHFENRHFFSKI